MKKLKLNYLAILAVVIISQVIPMIWYGIFADQWMEMNGLTMDYIMANDSNSPYFVALIASLVFAVILAWLFKRMNIESAKDGFITALAMGIPFSLLNLMTIYMFSFRPYELVWIDGGENLLIWGVAGLILGGWRKYESN